MHPEGLSTFRSSVALAELGTATDSSSIFTLMKEEDSAMRTTLQGGAHDGA